MRRAAIILAVLFGGAIAAIEYLNFSGFCYSQRRYLSSDELITIGIRENLRWHSPEPNSSRPKTYASVEDFHQQNANCCEIFRWNTGPFGNPLWLRAFGFYEALIDITYRIKDGADGENFYGSMALVDSCGAVRGVRGGPLASNLRDKG